MAGNAADAPALPATLTDPAATPVQMVPVQRIRVLNPRSRNRKVFAEIIENIAAIGLKRPITVAVGGEDADGPRYDLVCGQGRLEAYQALGEPAIPAIVITASEADCYLMSLVENLARRQHTSLDLLNAVARLSERGYAAAEIAAKTNLNPRYVQEILTLLRNGEERLVHAVEKGQLPLNVATRIAQADDGEIQSLLTEAYESGQLRGSKLLVARRIVERRRSLGIRFRHEGVRSQNRIRTAPALVKAYETEVRRQKLLIRKAELNEQRLLFLVTALKTLVRDENFLTLLRAERLATMPKYLTDEMNARGR